MGRAIGSEVQRPLAELGKRIAAQRSQRGLSQWALGEASGVGQTYVCRTERGLYLPSEQVVAKWAKTLRVPGRAARQWRELLRQAWGAKQAQADRIASECVKNEREALPRHEFLMREFGRCFRRHRQVAGVTQWDLQRDAGLSPSHLSPIEHGKFLPKLATVKRLLSVLKLSQSQRANVLSCYSEACRAQAEKRSKARSRV